MKNFSKTVNVISLIYFLISVLMNILAYVHGAHEADLKYLTFDILFFALFLFLIMFLITKLLNYNTFLGKFLIIIYFLFLIFMIYLYLNLLIYSF
jgi:cell division protein FtsW (lipid II flippase)